MLATCDETVASPDMQPPGNGRIAESQRHQIRNLMLTLGQRFRLALARSLRCYAEDAEHAGRGLTP